MERNTGENAFALLHRTSNRIRCLQAKFYQNVGDLRLLRMIAHHYPDGATPSRLAGRMGVALPTVSKKLTVLENQQLIERKMSDVDRRQTFIFVTEKGNSLLDEKYRSFARALSNASGKLGQDKLNELCDILSQLGEYLDLEINKEE